MYDLLRQRYTYEDARETLQASDTELDQGLNKRRVLIVNGACSRVYSLYITKQLSWTPGELRPISPFYLNTILESLLTHLVSSSLSHSSVSVEELGTALEDQYDIRRDISRQVMAWFGDIVGGEWSMDKTAVVREIGLGILRPYRVRRAPRPTLKTDTHIDLHLIGRYPPA